MYRPYPPRWITKKRFIQVGNSLLLSKQFHALSTGSRFLYFCMAMESGGRKNFILPQKDAKMAHGVNPRSRLIRFSKNSSFHYFTVDEMGLRLMKLALDEMALYRFQRYLQQISIRTTQIFHPLLAVIRSRQNRRKALKLLDLLRNQNHSKLSSFIRCYP